MSKLTKGSSETWIPTDNRADADRLGQPNGRTQCPIILNQSRAEEYARAGRLLHEHSGVFMLIAQELVDHGEVPRQKLADWLGLQLESEPSLLEPYADRLAAFESQLRTMDRLVGKRPCMEAEAA